MKYILTDHQFGVLLSFGRLHHVYTFQLELPREKMQILQAMAQLYSKKLLLLDKEGQLVPAPVIASILACMKQAPFVLKLEFAQPNPSIQLVYPAQGNSLVLLERQCGYGQSMLKISLLERTIYLHDLFENQLLPNDGNPSQQAQQFSMEAAALEDYKTMDTALHHSLVTVQRYSSWDGQPDYTLEVLQSPIYKWIHLYNPMYSVYHLYTMQEIELRLMQLMKED